MITIINSLLLFAGLVGVYLTATVGYELLFNPLRKIPGPFLARFTRFWEMSALWRGQYAERIIKLHEEYGPYVRLSPTRVSCSNPEALKTIYALGGGWSKSEYYDGSGNPHAQNLFNDRDESRHSQRRRMIAQFYSMSTMVNYEEAVNKTIETFESKFNDFAKEKRVIDGPATFQHFAFDIIGEITWGKSFSLLESESDTTGILNIVHSLAVYHNFIGLIPIIHSILFAFGNTFGHILKLEPPSTILRNIVANQTQEFADQASEKKDNAKAMPFLAKLLGAVKTGKIDALAVVDSCTSNVVAGSDSTSAAMSSAFYYIYHTPTALAKLREEIEIGAREGRVSDPITFAEAQQLPYLQAVIKEALRIGPPAAQMLPRSVPKGGVEFDGYFFPANTAIGGSAWTIGYNSKYVPNPREFQPERFLNESTLDSNTKLCLNFAFGAGARTCIGKNISLLEMTKLIPQVVRNFNLVFVDHHKPMEVNTLTFFNKVHYDCWVQKRQAAEKTEGVVL